MTYLALLRGVNVGGKNKLPMKDLALLFTEAGCKNVRTYIQSGNVIFNAPAHLAARLPDLIAAQILERFDVRTQIILRRRDELTVVLLNNPFLKAGAPEESLHVLFLAGLPDPSHVDNLDPHRSPPDEFIVLGREIYLRLPNGAGRSKLTNSYFDSKLKTVSTGRNWRTVNMLSQVMRDSE